MRGVEWFQTRRVEDSEESQPVVPTRKFGIGHLPGRKSPAFYTVEYSEDGTPVVKARGYFASENDALDAIDTLRDFITTVDDRTRSSV